MTRSRWTIFVTLSVLTLITSVLGGYVAAYINLGTPAKVVISHPNGMTIVSVNPMPQSTLTMTRTFDSQWKRKVFYPASLVEAAILRREVALQVYTPMPGSFITPVPTPVGTTIPLGSGVTAGVSGEEE